MTISRTMASVQLGLADLQLREDSLLGPSFRGRGCRAGRRVRAAERLTICAGSARGSCASVASAIACALWRAAAPERVSAYGQQGQAVSRAWASSSAARRRCGRGTVSTRPNDACATRKRMIRKSARRLVVIIT